MRLVAPSVPDLVSSAAPFSTSPPRVCSSGCTAARVLCDPCRPSMLGERNRGSALPQVVLRRFVRSCSGRREGSAPASCIVLTRLGKGVSNWVHLLCCGRLLLAAEAVPDRFEGGVHDPVENVVSEPKHRRVRSPPMYNTRKFWTETSRTKMSEMSMNHSMKMN